MEEKLYHTVLITGASHGIGAAIAKAFAKKGSALSLTGRNKEALASVACDCKALGAVNVLQVVADLKDEDGIEKTIQSTMKTYSKLDVLINNAGLYLEAEIENTKWTDFNTLCSVNLKAPFYLTQMSIPYLQKSKGNIINMSSIDSQAHYTDSVIYGITKAALDHFTKTAAFELSAKGIRVNAVNPGMVHTNILSNLKLKETLNEYFARQESMHPLEKRNIKAEEIADAVLFLSSDAAKMITGVCLNVDGGRALTRQ